MCTSTSLVQWSILLTVYFIGGAICASIKGGGVNGTKSRNWSPPKDWDWSVTPGRLIPVSEATDDLPTPGYRMSQLQQRVPIHHEYRPFPFINAGSLSTESSPEEKVVLIGQAKQNSAVNLTNNESTSAKVEEHSTPEYNNPRPPFEEQELILLNDEPIVYQRGPSSADLPSKAEQNDRVPVEETMVKVELPEICSITGLGCRDRKPAVPHDFVREKDNEEVKPEDLQHPVDDQGTTGVPSTSEISREQMTEVSFTTIKEEQTTNLLPSSTLHGNEHVPHDSSDKHSSDSQSGNNNNNTSFPHGHNETEITEEESTHSASHFNFSIPEIVHSVVNKVEEYIGYKNTSSNDTESPIVSKNVSDHALLDSPQVVEGGIQQQQEQQVQQEFLGNVSSQQEERHYDEQKLLGIANSWETSTESNATSEKRMDAGEADKTKKEVDTEKVGEKKGMNGPESDAEFKHDYRNDTQITDHHGNSTESPTIGAKIENYWNAAKGYVSKALHL